MKSNLFKELKSKIEVNKITVAEIEAKTIEHGEHIAAIQIERTLESEHSSVGLFCTITGAVNKIIKDKLNIVI